MYSISEEGRVYTHYKNKWIRSTLRKGDTSYYKVGLLISSTPKKYRHWYIHQLLMLTFIGPCPKGMQVDHIDGNSLNNSLDNLRYVSAKDNSCNRKRHGKHYTSFIRKVNPEAVLLAVNCGMLFEAVARLFEISERQVSRIYKEKHSA